MAEWTRTCNGNYGSAYVLKLVATENSTSTANNTSSVTTSLYIKANAGYRYYGFTSYGTINIAGTAYTSDSTGSSVEASDWLLLSSKTKNDVGHDADGSKTITVSGTFDTTYGNLTSTTISGSLQLTKIPRYFTQTPSMTISNITETAMDIAWGTSESCKKVIVYWKVAGASSWSGSKTLYESSGATSGSGSITGLSADTNYDIKITCTRTDSSLNSDSAIQTKATYPYPYISAIGTSNLVLPAPSAATGTLTQTLTIYNPRGLTGITVYAKKDSTSGTQFISKGSVSGTSTTLSFTQANVETMYNSIPSSTSGKIVYYCVTSGNTSTRIAEGAFSTTIANCKPTISGNLSYINLTNASLIGEDTVIQGHSSFKITCPAATTLGGAIINNYYFKIGDADFENNGSSNERQYASTLLNSSVTIYAYALDSRGYATDQISTTMRIVPYSAPTATCLVKRTGYTTGGSITVSATRTDLKNSSNQSVNAWMGDTTNYLISLSVSPSGPTFADGATIGTSAASFTNATKSISSLALDKSYEITVNISDKLTTRTLTFPIEKAHGLLAIMDDCEAVGINTIPNLTDAAGLYVQGVSNVSSNASVGGNLSVTGGVDIGGAAHVTGSTYTDALYIGGIKVIWWE